MAADTQTSERQAQYSVNSLFLDRWSPRAMSGEEIPHEELMSLFEAARWAPSSFNNQPWRFLYARRGTPEWNTFLDLLMDINKIWAKNAAVLIVFVSRRTFERNGAPSRTHTYDTGAAWENMALQGWMKGWVVHGMEGFDYEKARTALNVPKEYDIEAMAAVGKPGRREDLPPKYQEMEHPSSRKSLSEIAFEGSFSFQA